MQGQETWSSRTVFILAAIGSAAGLGNLWKFPYLVYDNGGLAFIIAYLVMLFLVGLGLLIGEVAFGQMTRKGIIDSFGTVSKYIRWIGWATVLFAFTILTYYIIVIAWGMDYLYYSLAGLFSGTLAWSADASGFFFGNVLGITDSIGDKGALSYIVLYGTIISLVLLYLFTFKSVKSVGKVILITATLPFVTLFILAIRAMTLENSGMGIDFITSLDASKLLDFGTWTAAGGQIFFTLSLAMGVMIAYGAFKKKSSEIVKATIIVAIGNTVISFLSAITVFGTLGYLAGVKGVDVTEVVKGGPSLVFTTIPETLTHFSSFSALFSVIFFLTIFLLAIDSAMSLIEAITIVIKNAFQKVKIELITLGVIILLGLISSVYMYGNGLYVLDIVDHYITELVMLIVGLIELIIFLLISKRLTAFISQRNECFLKFVINNKFFIFSWSLGIVLIGTLIFGNIQSGYLVYDSYETSDLISYGLVPIGIVLLLSIAINIFELKKIKKES